MPSAQELETAKNLSAQFQLQEDFKDQTDIAARAAATLAEANVVSVLTDKDGEPDKKKRRVQKELDSLKSLSKVFNQDLNSVVHPRVLSEGVSFVLHE